MFNFHSLQRLSVQDLIANCPTYLFVGCYSDSYYASSDIPMYPTLPPLRLSMWGRHKVDKLGSNSGYADRPVVKAGNGTFRLKRKKLPVSKPSTLA